MNGRNATSQSVLIRAGDIHSKIIAAAVAALLAFSFPADACENRPVELTGEHQVTRAENGTVFLAGGNAQYQIQFGSAAKYPEGFCVEVINKDFARSKDIILPNRLQPLKLWPLQTSKIRGFSWAWYDTSPGRWRHPGGSFDLFTNYDKGSDASDCLSEEQPCKSVARALAQLCDHYDFNGTIDHQSHAFIRIAKGTIDLDGVHWACRLTGGQGGQPITITGGSICPEDASAIGTFTHGAVLHLTDIRLCSGHGNAVENALGGRVYVGNGVVFGPTPNGKSMNGDDIQIIGKYRAEP